MKKLQWKKKWSAMVLGVALTTGLIGAGVGPATGSAASLAANLQDTAGLARFVDEFFERPDIKEALDGAGAVVTVVNEDRVLLNKGYGYADVEKKVPVDPENTVFRIASISKAITATAVMQLVEQGKLDLNEDLSHYLGDVVIENMTDTPLTMKSLLTNATGFEFGDTADGLSWDLTKNVALKDYIKENAPTVVQPPGMFYRYDNLGFNIQGYVVENVSGQPFGEYVQTHIFDPLGMTNSQSKVTPQIVNQLAVPYDGLGNSFPPYINVPLEFPAGGMVSSGADMAKFMMAHLGGGQYKDAVILQKETAAEMHRPQLGIHPAIPNMAYGFEFGDNRLYNGRYVIEKGGDVNGFHSCIWLIPDAKVGLFVAVNKDMELRPDLLKAFMDRYFPETAPASAQEPLALSEQALAKFEGTYGDLRNRMWTIRVTAEEGKLLVKEVFGEHELIPLDETLFQDQYGLKFGFKLDDEGNAVALYYEAKPDSWARKLMTPEPYADVNADHPYAAYIYHLKQLEILQGGIGNENFHPDQPLTRAAFIGWFTRWMGLAPSKAQTPFTDIDNSPYKLDIQTAYQFDVLSGTQQTRFEPERFITRQEAATIMWRAANQHIGSLPKDANLSGVTDDWALEGVSWVVARGLHGSDVIKGADGATDYRSKAPMQRQEVAALLSMFADNLLDME